MQVNKESLISFSENKIYGKEAILKVVEKKEFQECLEYDFFVKVDENKYRFTEKGMKFAWSK